jgi:hypothetical protein
MNTLSFSKKNSIHTLIIYGCNKISKIPPNLKMHTLEIYGFNTISEIPQDLEVKYLNIWGKMIFLQYLQI